MGAEVIAASQSPVFPPPVSSPKAAGANAFLREEGMYKGGSHVKRVIDCFRFPG
jgi:hypothetical protein